MAPVVLFLFQTRRILINRSLIILLISYLSVPDEGYYVPDDGYDVPDDGYDVPDDGYDVLDDGYDVPDEGDSRNASCALN